MSVHALIDDIQDAKNWNFEQFGEFAQKYLTFAGIGENAHPNIQADIVSVKNNDYHFLQYRDDGNHRITRPINFTLFIKAEDFEHEWEVAKETLENIRNYLEDNDKNKARRDTINKVLYTCQQSIGCTLDALSNDNKARKRNGAIFEVLIREAIAKTGVSITHRTEKLKIKDSEEKHKFEHDLILLNEVGEDAAIGQIKTSTKERLDKVFLDHVMYKYIKDVDIPYFLIVLNDVQRSNKRDGNYSISSTFLPGHFKAYTIAFNPLDGVYYIDKNTIKDDEFINDRIFTFDKLLFEDMWRFIE